MIPCPPCSGDGIVEFPRHGCCPEHCLCADMEPCESCHGTGEVTACARCEVREEPDEGLLCAECELAVELEFDLDAYRADLEFDARRDC
jgi:RecJ-like exonuclease